MPEVYAWPEGALFVHTNTDPAQTGNPLAFVQDVSLDAAWQWKRELSPVSALMRARVTFTLEDRPVTFAFRARFTSLALFLMAQSATAVNADFQLSAHVSGYQSAAFRCLSGVFERFRMAGQEGGIYEAEIAMQFAEVSAYWQ